MSDGPHRSLNMRRRWQKAAEAADNDSFESAQVWDCVCAAIADDWQIDVPDDVVRTICDVLGGGQNSLFHDQKVLQLKALRRLCAGHPLAQLLVDCALLSDPGSTSAGSDPAVEAAARALAVWIARHGRQAEEHYCRKSNDRRAQHMKARLEAGGETDPLRSLARQLLKLEPASPPRTPSKQTGLDDGVRL